jgi:hypothetical protein
MSAELLTLAGVAPTPVEHPPRRSAPVRSASRSRLGAYPADRVWRWTLRLALALPFVAVALLQATASGPPHPTPNADLLARVAHLDWSDAGAALIGTLYPPISTIIALFTPFGEAGLAVVGALVAGVLLQKMIEALVQRGLHPTAVVGFVVALAANPLFFYTATQNLPAFLGLSFFALAMDDLRRFAVRGDTQSGFRAGILLMLASLSDGGVILAVVVATVTAPLLSAGRTSERGIGFARAVVVLFPTLSAFGAVVLLDLLFLRRPLEGVAQLVSFDPSRLAIFPSLVTTHVGILLLAPVGCAWVLALLVRRPGAVVISLLLFASIVGGYLLGLVPPQSAGNAYILMLAVATALTPALRSAKAVLGLNLLLVLQVLIAWESGLERPIVLDWMMSLVHLHG